LGREHLIYSESNELAIAVFHRWFKSNHPFRHLLFLEWILLGVALLDTLSPPHRGVWRIARRVFFPLGGFLSIAILGGLGLRLPFYQSRWQKILYTALGFGLSWLTVFLGGYRSNTFAALLLVVVMRACLLFDWKGRIGVAALAFGSFLLRLYASLWWIQKFPVDLPPPFPPPRFLPRRMPSAEIQELVFHLSVGSAILFGLVLIFVLLMVGTLISEYQSREKLAQANDRLRRYALLIENQATVQERSRIAREIHDSVGHSLAAQSIQLENVAQWFESDVARAKQYLQTARNLGREALQQVRQAVATLRTDPLKQQSFSEALTHLVQEFEQHTQIPVQVTLQRTERLSKEQAIALYRLIQEALTNISKHSGASQVQIQVGEQQNMLHVEIVDNGRGFDPTQHVSGFGLHSMAERAEALGGRFKVISQPGQGCTLQVNVPMLGGSI
jgi:signal transduction histidine kinase